MKLISLSLLFLVSTLSAGIKSTTGQIKFDTQGDHVTEMILDSTGLGIGATPSANLHVQGNAIVTDQLIVGSCTGGSNLCISGSLGLSCSALSANATLGAHSLVLIDSSSDNIVLTLPYAANVIGQEIQIKKTSTQNQVMIRDMDFLNIDGSYAYYLSSGNIGAVKIMSHSNGWSVISSMPTDSDPAWTPSLMSTAMWLDASDASSLTAGPGGNVSTWQDKSGNDRHVTQSTSSLQAISGSNTINGLNVLSFDGVDDFFDNTSNFLNGQANLTMIAVFLQETNTSGMPVFIGKTSVSNEGIGMGYNHAEQKYNAFIWGSGSPVVSFNGEGYNVNKMLITTRDDSPSYDLFVDGNQIGPVAGIALTLSTSPVKIGKTGWAGQELDGLLAEVLILDYTASTSQRQLIEGYLAWKWGLQGDLPASHPYRHSGP